MKKVSALFILFIYLVFSQFAIKAIATTQFTDDSGNEIVCVTKKLNTLDGKQDCREKHNSASFDAIFEYSQFLLEKGIPTYAYEQETDLKTFIKVGSSYLAQAPPGDRDDRSLLQQIYAHTYVGVILLLD